MLNITWLTEEAKHLHAYFVSIFYGLITVFLLIGVVAEYFKLPLGAMPSPGVLVGRALIAVILLVSYNEIANALASIADAIAQDLGNLDKLDGVLKKMSERIDNHSVEWLNAKSMVVTILSILTYTFLFYSVIIAEVAHVFTWTLLFVFAPLLIALFVLPATASATKALYRSLVEVAFWKITWSAIAALLWASVLIDMETGNTLDFMKMICINLILGGSLLATPFIVHALGNAGLSGFTRDFSGIATAAGFMTPSRAVHGFKNYSGKAQNIYRGGTHLARQSTSIGAQAALFAKNPVMNTGAIFANVKKDAANQFQKSRRVIFDPKNTTGDAPNQNVSKRKTSFQRYRDLHKKVNIRSKYSKGSTPGEIKK
jgi:hypothetical protein